ncbi:MAG TPA: ACP S-malonyltransferase [Candidatus Polarisedimenticolia bacterium]|nr:ACP S-malonyltransferase [Candidatus Polarisedimenticolia bacterium]
MSARAPRAALLFPGQGSQAVGMGRSLHDTVPEARRIFERVDRALGTALSRACFEGPEEALRLTATTQPAILATSIAALEALKARLGGGWAGIVACAAGHSLGEYSALVASGSLGLEDAVRTVRRRGEYMQEAVPVGAGGMAALIGGSLEQVLALCQEAAQGEVLAPANLNAPDQTVVAGSAAAIERLASLAREHGVRKVVRLPVSAPFHCALMEPARLRLAKDLESLTLGDAAFPVLPNVSAEPTTDAAVLRAALARQVTAPVRWVETIRRLAASGARALVEIGPGRVLTGLARRITPDLTLLNVEDPASLEATVDRLQAEGGAA